MFDSLDETMKHDEEKETSPKERMMRYAMTALISIAVVGGILFSIRMLN
jgi:hypothetical protein